MDSNDKLVTIGLPTYNRAPCLARAIESALSQDYSRLEVVISDNASTDDTVNICRSYQSDSRVRYIRQSTNQGPTKNFMTVLQAARGEYFMWLADDDWLDPQYVSACVKVLSSEPQTILVGGRARFYEENGLAFEDPPINLLAESSSARVRAFYRQVIGNSIFYGVTRRSMLDSIPLVHKLGGDWLLTAALAFKGRIRTLDIVCIHRSANGGASSNSYQLAVSFDATERQAQNPISLLAKNIFEDIAWHSSAYASLTQTARLILASQAALILYTRWSYRDRDSLAHRINHIRWRMRLRTRLKRLIYKAQIITHVL